MFEIPLYKTEIDAGLGKLIRSTAKIALASKVQLTEKFTISEAAWACLKNVTRAKAALGDMDLHYLSSILATAGWNNNDDVFDPLEMWQARNSPIYKPVNYQHVGSDIIGSTIASRAVDIEGKAIAEDVAADALPAKYHILNEDVLYKVWEDPKLQERMDQTLAEIAKGEWFVSMECLFRGFDYALKGSDTQKVVARNSQTAFLTKHLKAYGGTGEYGDYKVGRIFRNLLFSGKGLVRNPANPESVILDSTQEFSTSTAQVVTDFTQLSEPEVYSSSEAAHSTVLKQESTHEMAIDIETQKQLDALRVENETLKASLKDNDLKSVAAAKDKAEAKVADLTKQLDEAAKASVVVTEDNKAIVAKLEESKKALEEAQKSLAEVKEELKGIYSEQKKADRLAKVKAALHVEADKAESVADAVALAETMYDLADDKFDAQLKVIAKFTPAKLPEKKTPAQEAPAATSKPAPMAGKAASEEHDANEGNADAAALAQAEVEKTQAALATVSADAGVNEVAKQVAEFFGCTAAE